MYFVTNYDCYIAASSHMTSIYGMEAFSGRTGTEAGHTYKTMLLANTISSIAQLVQHLSPTLEAIPRYKKAGRALQYNMNKKMKKIHFFKY